MKRFHLLRLTQDDLFNHFDYAAYRCAYTRTRLPLIIIHNDECVGRIVELFLGKQPMLCGKVEFTERGMAFYRAGYRPSPSVALVEDGFVLKGIVRLKMP